MCRKYMVLAAALIAFGCGLIVSLLINTVFVKLCLAAVSIAIGLAFLKGNC